MQNHDANLSLEARAYAASRAALETTPAPRALNSDSAGTSYFQGVPISVTADAPDNQILITPGPGTSHIMRPVRTNGGALTQDLLRQALDSVRQRGGRPDQIVMSPRNYADLTRAQAVNHPSDHFTDAIRYGIQSIDPGPGLFEIQLIYRDGRVDTRHVNQREYEGNWSTGRDVVIPERRYPAVTMMLNAETPLWAEEPAYFRRRFRFTDRFRNVVRFHEV